MVDHFDFLAPIYDRILGTPHAAEIREKLRLPTEGWLLDAGGGTGRVSSYLCDWTGNIVVSDGSQKMLREVQKREFSKRQGLHPIRSHCECLPFANHQFDRILVVDALHHFRDQERALTEFIRILKPGGRLLIQEPDIRRFAIKMVACAEKIALMGSRFYTPQEIANRLTNQGLSISITAAPLFSVWIAADKTDPVY